MTIHVLDAGDQIVLDKKEFMDFASQIPGLEIQTVDRSRFFGKVHLGLDPLEFQKKARNEWN